MFNSNNFQIEPKNPEGAGGEPQMKKEYNFELPPIEDLQSPYVFTNTWNSAKRDVTYTMHAEIIRKLDLERIHNSKLLTLHYLIIIPIN